MSVKNNPAIAQETEAQAASRAAFEAHFRRTRTMVELTREGEGYRYCLAQDAWMDWQAGAASVQLAAAVTTPGSDERVPGIGHPTTYADLARLTPAQLWNRWFPEGRSVDAREAFIAARNIPSVPMPPATAGAPAGGPVARDAALLRWLMANPCWGMRWRSKAGKEQWQMCTDGESWGKWGSFREVLQAAAAANPLPAGAERAEEGAAPQQGRKTEAQHRADFELALKGNNLKRHGHGEVSHAAYMDSMIDNMWHGWMRKAKFDGATMY